MIAAALALALVVAPMGGSDDPTPYTVDESGITLPAGVKFADNGHVNLMTEPDGGYSGATMHFEGKCVTRTDAECAGKRHADAQFIGESFIPWSAFGLEPCQPVYGVQIDFYSEHYGEGGQPPVVVGPCEVDPPVEPPVDPPVVDPPVDPPVVDPPFDPPVTSVTPALPPTGFDPSILWFAAVWLGIPGVVLLLSGTARAAMKNPELEP